MLREFNAVYFCGIAKRVDAKRKELAEIQAKLLGGLNSIDLIELEKSTAADLNELMLTKESFYKQKSRIDWILDGG